MTTAATVTTVWRCFVCGKTTEDVERHQDVRSAEGARVFYRPRGRGWKTCDGLPVCTNHQVVAVDNGSPLLEAEDVHADGAWPPGDWRTVREGEADNRGEVLVSVIATGGYEVSGYGSTREEARRDATKTALALLLDPATAVVLKVDP